MTLGDGRNLLSRCEPYVTPADRCGTYDAVLTAASSKIVRLFNYLNAPPVHASLVKVSKDVFDELARANDSWVAQGNTSTGVARYWREWIKRYLEKIAEFSKDWAEMSAEESRTFWEGQDEEEQPAKTYVLAGLATLKAQFDDIRVDLTDFD